MAALTPSFWSFETHSYWLDVYSTSPGALLVVDILRSTLLSVCTVLLAGKSSTILKLLQKRDSKGKNSKGDAGVYAVTSIILFLLFAVGTFLYWMKVIFAIKETLCAAAVWDAERGGVYPHSLIRCKAFFRNGYLHDPIDNALALAFAIKSQVILTIANGILVYRCSKVFSDMWMVYIPINTVYVLWVAISFVEIYTILRFDWDVPVYPRFFQLTFNELMHLCYALSFTLNFLITVTIATRRFLAMRGRWLSNGGPEAGTSFPLDNKKSPGYNKATILLVDAALPPTLCSFAILVAYFTPYSGLRIQGVFAVLWLTFSVMAPHLIAIHNLRAELKEDAGRAGMAAMDKPSDPLPTARRTSENVQ